MDKTSEKVARDPKRDPHVSHETYMKRLRGKILEDNQLPTDRSTPSTPSSTPPTTSSTANSTPSTPPHTTRSNDTYVYGVGILAVVAIGACVFFAGNTFQPKNKKNNQ